MSGKTLGVAAVAAATLAVPAFAHHSFAMFDQEKTITLKGTVKEFEWNNPHVWMRIMVMDQATGKPLQYAMEMGSVARSTYDGWKRDSVKPGDAVTVSIHPLKDGTHGGQYLSVTFPDGRTLGLGNISNVGGMFVGQPCRKCVSVKRRSFIEGIVHGSPLLDRRQARSRVSRFA